MCLFSLQLLYMNCAVVFHCAKVLVKCLSYLHMRNKLICMNFIMEMAGLLLQTSGSTFQITETHIKKCFTTCTCSLSTSKCRMCVQQWHDREGNAVGASAKPIYKCEFLWRLAFHNQTQRGLEQ